MLFVILRSSSPVTVPKVLQVAHQTKRIRHKAGDDSELYQYVQYDTVQPQVKKGPRIIKLDDDAVDKDKYKPPENLIVHLSKIPMPELQPKVKHRSASDPASSGQKAKDSKEERRRREKEEKERERRRKEREKLDKGKGRASELGPAEAVARPANTSGSSSNRLTKRGSPSPSRLSPPGHTPAHRAHPTQPSPSPSQINNPSIYAAPPVMPPRRSPAPPNHTANLYPSHVPDTFHRPPGAYPMPQRPVSAYGGYMGPPPPQQQPVQPKPTTATSLMNGLLDKLRL